MQGRTWRSSEVRHAHGSRVCGESLRRAVRHKGEGGRTAERGADAHHMEEESLVDGGADEVVRVEVEHLHVPAPPPPRVVALWRHSEGRAQALPTPLPVKRAARGATQHVEAGAVERELGADQHDRRVDRAAEVGEGVQPPRRRARAVQQPQPVTRHAIDLRAYVGEALHRELWQHLDVLRTDTGRQAGRRQAGRSRGLAGRAQKGHACVCPGPHHVEEDDDLRADHRDDLPLVQRLEHGSARQLLRRVDQHTCRRGTRTGGQRGCFGRVTRNARG
eukprot:scaffold23655_cov65-Phaeocystis_antarctica.AAC.4